MNWEKPKYSKSQVRKAVKNIENKPLMDDAMQMLTNYRSSHTYPMQSMFVNFNRKAEQHDESAIIVRRLKRMPSILSKLKREPTMQISTMGDIGGIRIIVRDINTVKAVSDSIRHAKTKNKLYAINDYLSHPKPSGYRSIHLLYNYQGNKEEYKGHRIELQIRSQVQHAWATAVEVIDTFRLDNLKSGQGNKEWADFFRLTSVAFSDLENGYLNINKNNADRKALSMMVTKLDVIDILIAYSQLTIDYIDKKVGYYIIRLDTKSKEMQYRYFSEAHILEALTCYIKFEHDTKDTAHQNVVMVHAKSIQELKRAYPNYFADTANFVKFLKEVLRK